MITKKAIENIYKKYNTVPESPDCLDIVHLFESADPSHGIEFDGDNLVINSVDPCSPFHKIPLDLICGIVDFEETVAVVLRRSIVFLSKKGPQVNIHLKEEEPSFIDRIRNVFGAVAAL